MKSIIEKSKELFIKKIKDYGSDPYTLLPHLDQAEKWVRFMTKKYPDTDAEILLISIWLHDIGHYPIPTKIDHAIRGEEIAKEFLIKENYNKNKLDNVLHCIRSHRCRDIMPETFEAKIIAFCDSASHMTDSIYMEIAKDNKVDIALEKLERDFRDLSLFPEVKNELKGLYESWKRLLTTYKKLNLE